jgi:hypothetical protein
MAKSDTLELGAGLIKKGQARGVDPSVAADETPPDPFPAKSQRHESPAAPNPSSDDRRQASVPATQMHTPPDLDNYQQEHPPLKAMPALDVPKRFTSFRLPVDLDEEMRAMIFETRRTKQDLLEEFVRNGVQQWRRDRQRR